MRQCVFPACKSRPDNRVGNIALIHRFPREDRIREQWVQWIRQKCDMPNFEFNAKAGLCYRHFDRSCYHRSNGLLKPFSYPSYTPKDLDKSGNKDFLSNGVPISGAPKTNLIIKVDPTLVKNSTSDNTDPGKKWVLLVTDQGGQVNQAPTNTLPFVNRNESGVCLVGPQEVPPLRFIGRGPITKVPQTTLSNQNEAFSNMFRKSAFSTIPPEIQSVSTASNIVSVPKNLLASEDELNNQTEGKQKSPFSSTAGNHSNWNSCNGEVCSNRSTRTQEVVQIVLSSARRRIQVYRRRLQLEKKKFIRIEKLLNEMRRKQLISVGVAEKFEAILHDE